jgi:hypothetical protein
MAKKPQFKKHTNKSYKFADGGFVGGFAQGFGSTSKWTGGQDKAKSKDATPGASAPTPMPTPAAPTPQPKPTLIPEVGTRQ